MVVPLPHVINISKLLPYKFLYLLFFINLVICEIKWIPVVIRKCKKPKPPGTLDEMERFGHKTMVTGQWSVVSSGLEKYLRRRGYKIQIQDSGVMGQSESREDEKIGRCEDEHSQPLNFSTSHLLDSSRPTSHVSPVLYAYKGRFSPIGNLLFHFSFLFLLAGIALSMFYRFDGTLLLAEGQELSGPGQYLSYSATGIASPPEMSFKVEKITPSFWRDALLFVDLKADVAHGADKEVVRLSQPLKMDGAKVTITGMGITPLYVFKDAQGRESDSGYVNLNIFMPGAEDNFQIPGTPYKVYVSFYPDFELKDNKPVTRSMNPVNPAFGIRVSGYGGWVFNGYLRPGEEANFDGLSLSFPEFKYAGLFKVVYDRGFGLIWSGFILMITGLAWRLLIYKKEIVVWKEGDATYIAGHTEHYKNLFKPELECIAGVRRIKN